MRRCGGFQDKFPSEIPDESISLQETQRGAAHYFNKISTDSKCKHTERRYSSMTETRKVKRFFMKYILIHTSKHLMFKRNT